jgi:hypothetical protein
VGGRYIEIYIAAQHIGYAARVYSGSWAMRPAIYDAPSADFRRARLTLFEAPS